MIDDTDAPTNVPEYPKIHSLYKRDQFGRFTPEWARPEFEYLAGLTWRWTEKVDGTNIRILLRPDGTHRVFGRTAQSQVPPSLSAAIGASLDAERVRNVTAAAHTDVILYGEGYGPKINSGGLYRDDQSFVLFDVRVGRWWLLPDDVDMIGRQLCVDLVPLAGLHTLDEAVRLVRDGQFSYWGRGRSAFYAEGLVGTPLIPLFARDGSRIITKIRREDFVT